MAITACGQDDGAPVRNADAEQEPSGTAGLKMVSYRVRSDADAGLNDDAWAGPLNSPATVKVDEPFRLRVEVENAAASASPHQFSLQYRRNDGPWLMLTAEDFPYPVKEKVLDFSEMPEEQAPVQLHLEQGEEHNVEWLEGEDEAYLQLSSANLPVMALGDYHTHWAPMEYKAVLRLNDAAEAGIVFAYRDDKNHYRLDMKGGAGAELTQRREGKDHVLERLDFEVPVKANQWIEVAVVLEGKEITVEYEWDPIITGIEWSAELAEAPPASVIGLYLPPQSAVDVMGMEVSTDAKSPIVSIVNSDAYLDGAATEDLLVGSNLPFAAGSGISFAPITPTWSASQAHGEWEFPMVLRYFADGAVNNMDGDRFEFRLTDGSGVPISAERSASVVADVPDGHLGGTFVETPARLGPWQAADGSLYFLMEPSETDNMMMIVKSLDGGKSWLEVDGAHRPSTGDLEGVATAFDGERIHILHQTSDDVLYHLFHTSASENADRWAIQDEVLASPSEPPVQMSDLALRSDGSIVGIYSDLHKVLYRVRSNAGKWSEASVIDAEAARDLSGPTLVTGKGDIVHMAYTGFDGTAWYRRVLPSGELTQAQRVAEGLGTETEDAGGILPLTYSSSSGLVHIMYRMANGELWHRQVNTYGELSTATQITHQSVVRNAADSEQVGADAIVYEDQIHVVFIEEDSGRLFHTWRDSDQSWSEPKLVVDGEEVLWVRGAVVKNREGAHHYGFVYDGGSQGGSGMNRYLELPLEGN